MFDYQKFLDLVEMGESRTVTLSPETIALCNLLNGLPGPFLFKNNGQLLTSEERDFIDSCIAKMFDEVNGEDSPPPPIQATIFEDTIPTWDIASSGSGNVGVRFATETSGNLIGIRHYRLASTPNGYTATLYETGGFTSLGVATFPNDEIGWTVALFDEPIAINSFTDYMATVYAPSGNIPVKTSFYGSPVVNGHLVAFADNSGGGVYNGTYNTAGSASVPTLGFMASNFWVDVLVEYDE